MSNLLKKLFALFMLTQIVQAYTAYRLNKVADQFTIAHGVRPVVLPPANAFNRMLIAYAENEDVNESTAKIDYVAL